MADIAVGESEVGTGEQPRRHLLSAPFRWFAAIIAGEGERRILWLPVCLGLGIALYFTLAIEPPLWLGLAGLAPAAIAALMLRRWPTLAAAALALAFVAGGFALVQGARWERGAPLLDHRMSAPVSGRVVDIDTLDRGWRVIVAVDPLPGLDADEEPRLLRIHIAASSDRVEPGDTVRMKAMLYPVPAPILPGGRDMQRELYFAGIGGVGYSLGPAHRTGEATSSGGREWLLRLRTEMTRRISTVLPGSTGGIASALITGKRGTIAEDVKEAFRETGLSHLLAIAGLHLGLVGGFVFFTVRGVLALIPRIALRWPIKHIAALVTLVVLFCYLMISGAAIPTERAFVMNGIIFAAIFLRRLRLSMRVCALAALVVLMLDPASLVGVSFQMSFGAVVALIAVYESWGGTLARIFHRGSWGQRAIGYCGAVVVTTLVATLGTEPFSIYHFHRFVVYSPLANVIAVPISAAWTLPCGVFACLLMPFGLERLALIPMGWGIDATIWVAEHVARLPGNMWVTPHLPIAGLVLIALGGLWLCLWQQKWRYWGVAGIVGGAATIFLSHPPDLVLADLGRFLAVRQPAGYAVAAGAEEIDRSFFQSETGADLGPWPGDLDCANGRCTYTAHGKKVAIVTAAAGLPIDCTSVDAIVAQIPAGFDCRGKVPVADRIDTWRYGAIGLWVNSAGVTLESANRTRGDRPWVPHPISRKERERAKTK
ncbi:MAG TPA: ComEC/Rec2 family competence protein [Stellaceae bacterium]|jgi:competence protein ComEC